MSQPRRLKSVDGVRWAAFKRLDIPDFEHPERTYLRRWRLIETPWFGIKLHHILLPDGDRAFHDHPWSFVSLILKGGYTEETPRSLPGRPGLLRGPGACIFRRRPGSLHRLAAEDLHRITELHGSCWTLVINGPRRREWGFVADGTWTDWRTYTGASS